MSLQLQLTFSEFAFGGLTENPASTSKNGIIKMQKFLHVRPPADANLVLAVRCFFSIYNYFFCHTANFYKIYTER